METTELARGEQFNVDTDHTVAVDASVQYATFRPGGVKNRAFGGEGNVAKSSRPGNVRVRNRDFESLAENVAGGIPGGGGGSDDGIGVSGFR